MEAQIIEPNPILIEYFQLTKHLAQSLNSDLSEFLENNEWHYVENNI